MGVLDHFAAEGKTCVSIDLEGVEHIDTSAVERLACSANEFCRQNRRLRIARVSRPVEELLQRLSLSDAFCWEEDCADCRPDTCGTARQHSVADVFTMPCDMAVARKARRRIADMARLVGFDDSACGDIAVAVGEAVTNAVNYGSTDGEGAEFTVRCIASPRKVCITVSDQGEGFDPDSVISSETDPMLERGRGLRCIDALMDEVSFDFESGTTVRMVKFA